VKAHSDRERILISPGLPLAEFDPGFVVLLVQAAFTNL
jgi:hypothetical protein